MRSPSSTSLFADSYALRRNPASLPNLRVHSPSSSRTSSIRSTSSSSLSGEFKSDESSSEDDVLCLPKCSSASWLPKTKQDAFTAIPHTTLFDTSSCSRTTQSPSPSPIDNYSTDTPLTTPDPLPISEDDTAVRKEPSHHVDYLSYDWREEDIWSSWRHIVEHRKVYGERSRLENASWRTWAKSQFKLKTVSPDSLNWSVSIISLGPHACTPVTPVTRVDQPHPCTSLPAFSFSPIATNHPDRLKDVDVTWLYGPMQPASNRFCSQQTSEPASRLSKTNSFVNGVKKPILKKRSMSEAMLQKSLSSSSLVKQAAESVQAQQTTDATMDLRKPRPIIGRATSDFAAASMLTSSRGVMWEPTDYFSSKSTTGQHTPGDGEKKHIRFDDKVEQCIALECKEGDDDEEDFNRNPWAREDEESSSDEGVVMMKRARRRRPLSRTSSKTSVSTADNKTIAKLPSTTLKYRTDSPDVSEQNQSRFWKSSRLSPSPSQETLKPSNPSRNFLLAEDDDDDEEADDYFNPSGDFGVKRPSPSTVSDGYLQRSLSESKGMRRTESGMFMPFEDNEDDAPAAGLIGRIVDTVNTARDIAHVVWNAGWKG